MLINLIIEKKISIGVKKLILLKKIINKLKKNQIAKEDF